MLIEALQTLCDLADLKSFSKAAEANFVTQPAVSQQIKNLERIWNIKLIERQARGFSLTPIGETIVQKSKEILGRYDEMNLLIKQTAHSVGGTVRIAAIHGVGLHELPPYIKQFLKLYPLVNFSLEYMQDRLVYEQVSSRKADLGIVAFPTPRPNLEIIPFREDQLVIVCHPNHPLAKHKKIPLKKISPFNFIAFKKGIPTRRVLDQIFLKHRMTVKVGMEFDNIETIKRAIEIDAGISILPLVTIVQELERAALTAVRMEGEFLARALGILIQKKRVVPIAVSKFIEVLK